MTIRLSGMASGLDTESIVSALVSAYSSKKDKYVKAQTKLSWKQDAWKSLNTKVYSLYTSVGSLRYSSSYSMKKSTVSDSTKATITTGSNAINGTQTLQIKSLAKAGYLTGGTLQTSSGTDATSSSKLSELKYAYGDSGKISVTSGGETTEISVDKNTTIEDFVTQLNSAGVSASFDETNQRIFISSSSSGKDNDFSITASDEGGIEALSSLGLLTSSDVSKYTSTSSKFAVTDSDGLDEDATKEKIKNAIQTLHDNYTTIAEMPSKIKEAQAAVDAAETDEEKAEAQATLESYQAQLTAAQDAVDNLDEYTANIKSYMSNYSDSDWVQANVDTLTDKIYGQVETAYKVSSGEIDISGDNTATRVEGQDAEIILNGATFYSDSNSITVNGLTIQATGTTADGEELTVTTGTDTSGLYDKVKEFLSSYNSLINEMMELYNADSASDYEPLTDDEKAEMSDTEIEKWENKIKSSLLRRDTTLNSLITGMTTSMMKSYEINGKTYAFSSFGIATLGYLNAEENENYAYHIDGDSEDSYTSGNTDKLSAALAEDPDAVIEFMKNVTSDLYSSIGTKMKSTAVSSVYTVYNDKEMASEYSDYTTLIKTWTTRVSDMEDSYYSKFAAMESALATLQSNSSSVTSLLG